MSRSSTLLACLLFLASAVAWPPPSRAGEPEGAQAAAPRAQGASSAGAEKAPASSDAAAPRAQAPAEGTTSAAPPSLSPRLTPAPAPPATPAASGERSKDAGPAAAPAGPLLTVAEISEDTVRLAGPNVGLAPQQAGRVLGRDGATVARVVVDKLLENGVVARVVAGRENVTWGARVRFDAPAKR
jgi:hypothetical protein